MCRLLASLRMGRKAKAAPDGTDLGPLPDKVRDYPQEEGNIGHGKRYANRAAFLADVAAWKQEMVEREAKMDERRKAQACLRGKRRTPRAQPSGCQNRKTAATADRLPEPSHHCCAEPKMSAMAAELLEEGNPGLAALLDAKGPHCDDDDDYGSYEWERMAT